MNTDLLVRHYFKYDYYKCFSALSLSLFTCVRVFMLALLISSKLLSLDR